MSELKSTVADHYNTLERGLEERKQSRICYLRSFNNWIKSVTINEALQLLRRATSNYRSIDVLDLCCGKGGDLKKWALAKPVKINHVVFADMAGNSIKQAEDRYREMVGYQHRRQSIFGGEFIVADCADVRLTERYKNPEQTFDLISCQFSFHYSFESYERAETMLRNACERLNPGGIFIGTIPDDYELKKRLNQSEENGFGNEIYSVKFDSKEKTPLFGARYHFYLQESVDCPEFLVHFPLLEEMAKKYKMKRIWRYTFPEMFDEFGSHGYYRPLLERMGALETFPSKELMGSVDDGEYRHAEEKISSLSGSDRGNDRGRRPAQVGCMSKSEWEAVSMYIAFAFQKEGAPIPHDRDRDDRRPNRRDDDSGRDYRSRDDGPHRRDHDNNRSSEQTRRRPDADDEDSHGAKRQRTS